MMFLGFGARILGKERVEDLKVLAERFEEVAAR
jgi:hypothetical protein